MVCIGGEGLNGVLASLFLTMFAISAVIIVYAQYMDVPILRRSLYSIVGVLFIAGVGFEEIVSAVSPTMKPWIRVGYVGSLVLFSFVRLYHVYVLYGLAQQKPMPPPIYFARWRGKQAQLERKNRAQSAEQPTGLLRLLEPKEQAEMYRVGDALRFVYPQGITSANLDEARVVANAMFSGQVVSIQAHRLSKSSQARR